MVLGTVIWGYVRVSVVFSVANLWDGDLERLIKQGDSGYLMSRKRLETIQGQNAHIATVVPGANHFESHVCGHQTCKKVSLRAEERRDLRLIRHLLVQARRGISLNNLVFRLPEHMGRSDAFEQGIGGFDLRSGRAFRLLIPPELQHRKSQNFLEYVACMTQLVCLLVESDWQPGDSFLSIGNNSSAIGWIKKLNFKPEEEAEQATHLALARYMTRTLSDLDVIQFGQWLPGADNGVADALSRQHD
jgi:hypothetical protein